MIHLKEPFDAVQTGSVQMQEQRKKKATDLIQLLRRALARRLAAKKALAGERAKERATILSLLRREENGLARY